MKPQFVGHFKESVCTHRACYSQNKKATERHFHQKINLTAHLM